VAQQIVIDIVAETKKLTQGLDDTNKQLGGLDKNVKAAAKSAAALASAFVLKQGISFLKDGIEEAKDAAAAMRAANATFGEGSAALKKITADAEKFGKELAVDNDEIIKLATQLGSRLPKEITNDIIKLLSTSYQALADFAEIATQSDVDKFNLKYGVSLVLPRGA